CIFSVKIGSYTEDDLVLRIKSSGAKVASFGTSCIQLNLLSRRFIDAKKRKKFSALRAESINTSSTIFLLGDTDAGKWIFPTYISKTEDLIFQ
uniref:Uncharacterized protein n=1 Tax=Romanomermis culicivorax TaxID=13658 RepID=A0A915IW01_ROMCU